MLNIAVFDDQGFVVDAIISHFNKQSNTTSIKGFTSDKSLLEYIKDNDVNVVISDVLTENDIGLSIFEYLQSYYPKIRVIAYSSISSDFVKKCLIDVGVSYFINKKESLDVLYEAVLKSVNEIKQFKNDSTIPTLTSKEKIISDFLAQGKSAKEIADYTGNSVNTINNQKNELIQKFNCNNSTELIVKLGQLGLISII